MAKNMGRADRVIRILVALAIVVLYLSGTIGGTLAIVLGLVAAVFLITGLTGSCPGYRPLGLSTCGDSTDSPAS